MTYDGLLKFERSERDVGQFPGVGMKIMMNIGNPESAFTFGRCPAKASALRAWSRD